MTACGRLSGAFIHPMAIVEDGATVGVKTRIWAFAHVLAGATIGQDCNICDHTFIENDVTIGDRVTVKSGVYLWDGIDVWNDVFIGPNATFTNDRWPQSKVARKDYGRTVLKKGCSIGAGAIILPGIVIGEGAMVGAGAVVTTSIGRDALVYGNPARSRHRESPARNRR